LEIARNPEHTGNISLDLSFEFSFDPSRDPTLDPTLDPFRKLPSQTEIRNTALRLVSQFPNVCLLTEENNSEILQFLSKHQINTTGLSIRYDRSPNYFHFLQLQGEVGIAYGMRNNLGQLEGIGAFSYRRVVVQDELVWIGYVGDLKIAPSRKGAALWRQFYGAHLIAFEGLGVWRHYTAILRNNTSGSVALVKSEHSARRPFVYQKFWPYQMANVLGRKPRWLGLKAKEKFTLIEQPLTETSYRFLEFAHWNSLWKEHSPFPHMEAQKLFRLCVLSSTGEILASAIPFTTAGSKAIYLESLPASLRVLALALNLVFPSRPPMAVGKEISFLYAAQLRWRSDMSESRCAEVMSVLMTGLQKECDRRKCHFVSLALGENKGLNQGLRKQGWLFETVDADLYWVSSAGGVPPLLEGEWPPFEMALI
jgi:hypothetical protein